MQAVKVLFVCMGNICRSPTAHAVFRQLVLDSQLDKHIVVDSAGTHAYHIGNPPDNRSQQTAKKRGIHMQDLRARKVNPMDFSEFDYVLAMDHANYGDLKSLANREEAKKLHLFLDFADDHIQEEAVPDPYYGGDQGFEHVFDLVENASQGLLMHIRQTHGF